MRVLVACEYSGVVRDAFTKKGHIAMSCDILPTESLGNHYQGDVLDILDLGWDLMIAHPPCTYLSSAGERWFNIERHGDAARERHRLRKDAVKFFLSLINSNIPKVAVENPVGYMNTHFRKPDQIIQPYFFGDPESKRTCLWLKNLPPLKKTNEVEPKVHGYYKSGPKKGKPYYWCDAQYGKARAKERSKTFQGIADAMAEQWG